MATPSLAASPASVLPPGARVAGQAQAEYTVKWWQWINRLPPGVRAYQDPTGAQCALNQSGEVWFLAGTDGTGDAARHCRMPAGKHVFFPVINMIAHSMPGKPVSCGDATAVVRANNDHLGEVEVTIDGVVVRHVELHRLVSPRCFDAFPSAPYLKKAQSWYPAATDGYWLMLQPLQPGMHLVSVKARYDNPGNDLGDLEQVFEYQLQVEDIHTSEPLRQPGTGDIYM
ncbi:MAG TPA: hypothetical protein VM619_13665 [Luteimonas sp.]|nr:hypothetical protein [Luteimonas sp.]